MPALLSQRLTLGGMRDHVYFLADVSPSGVFPVPDINRLINIALNRVAPNSVIVNTTATAAGNSDETDYPLIDPYRKSQLPVVSSVTVDGSPVAYSLYAEGIRLAVAPNNASVIEVQYARDAGRLVLDTDTPEASLEAQEVACLYVVWQMKLKDDEFNNADRWQARYVDALSSLGPKPGVYKPIER